MQADGREVIVVGGGISGLTAAWHLRNGGVDVCLLEAASTVGGCMRTDRRDGFLLEKGPFNVIVRDPAFEALLRDLSDDVQVITASRSARRRYIYRRGRLHPVPHNPIGLTASRLLSVKARCRLLTGLLAGRRATVPEETIEQAAVRRFGREVSDTLVSAAVAGILAGDIRKLSLRACFPSVARIDREARSLLGYGLIAALRSTSSRKGDSPRLWRGLVSVDGGLGVLTATLGRRLGADLLTNCRTDGIHKLNDGYEVEYRYGESSKRRLCCRHLIIALPVAGASRLLQPLLPEAAAILRSIESASLVVVNLGFRRTDVGHPLDGYGFLVPHDEPAFPLMGVLWADSIFPHHAPSDRRLLRVFIGGARGPEAVRLSDDQLVSTAIDALRDLLQLSGGPSLVDLCRHEAAIPQYHLGHCEKIKRLRVAVPKGAGLYLIGNYLEGPSLNDCVRLAAGVAQQLVPAVRGPPGCVCA